MNLHPAALTTVLCATLLATPFSAQAGEEVVMIDGATHKIPTTVTLPEGDGPFPFVVMFHGTGSNRHEAGNGYDLLAPKLAEAGIASARFDFAGNGDSEVDYTEYTLTGGMQDGLSVIDYMRGLDETADDRVGVLGWSQGGTVTMLTAGRNPGISSLVTWAGALDMSGFGTDLYEEAKENGFAVMEFEWRTPLNVSIDWFEEVRNIDIAEELGSYDGAVLAIAGANDTVVDPAVTNAILAAASSSDNADKQIIPDADHTFNIFSGDMTAFDALIKLTVDRFSDTL
ncbi:alpha/beta hydrolase family protein [Cucumibacter marinus]|uniref:alpha/beta hydrolase family protein n=1 Tax=Cucumibacter marinus TaxID=1121252 RepID=UPI000686F18A|nr:alpha/beta fold hydrolase [Cucumibacter marinus]